MEFSAIEIAGILHGEVQGDPNVRIDKLTKIEEAQTGSLSFLANPKYSHYLYHTRASAVIVNRTFVPEKAVTPTLIRVDDAYRAFSELLKCYDRSAADRVGIEKHSFIARSARLGDSVYIGAFSYVGAHVKLADRVRIYPHVYVGNGVEIGSDTVIFPGVRIYFNTRIGKRCTLHSNAVIGADGFGFAPNGENHYDKIPQTGNVVVEDFVEIGSGTTIDRATLGSTVIRTGVKLDNQIQIAHNVDLGSHTVIAAQTGIAGSTKVGENCMIGGQVGIVGHLNIGDRVRIAAQSGVTSDLPDDTTWFGSPAMAAKAYRKSFVYFRKLPEVVKCLESLEKRVGEMERGKDVR